MKEAAAGDIFGAGEGHTLVIGIPHYGMAHLMKNGIAAGCACGTSGVQIDVAQRWTKNRNLTGAEMVVKYWRIPTQIPLGKVVTYLVRKALISVIQVVLYPPGRPLVNIRGYI
jgi:hypothetical protein